MVGEHIGQDSAHAFCSIDNTRQVGGSVRALGDGLIDWMILTHYTDPDHPEEAPRMEFRPGYVSVISETEHDHATAGVHIYGALRRHRDLKNLPETLRRGGLYTMRNGLHIPAIGLGTGGIPADSVHSVVEHAYAQGYRMLDSAREYQNEHIIGDVISKPIENKDEVMSMFVQSKVWPTELGFFPTANAIYTSRSTLKQSTISVYMLHWPKCYESWSWMHCHTTVDMNATWKQSYRALERAYAEGDIMSIGVSNFDLNLLSELRNFAHILPHVVQNFATVGQTDSAVRQWCKDLKVIYQPYAVARNIKSLSHPIRIKLNSIATTHNVSVSSVLYRYFIQLGTSIIPRSTDETHLLENLDVLSWSLSETEMSVLNSIKA